MKLSDNLLTNPYLFLPYTIQHDDRPEDIAYYYYGDVDKVWLVYLANDIIDPYTDWIQTDTNLEKTVRKKYELSDTLSSVTAGVATNSAFKHTDPVIVTFNGTIAGLTSGARYYVTRISASSIGLSTTASNALAGTKINFTTTIPITIDRYLDEFLVSTAIESNIVECVSTTDSSITVTYDTYKLGMTVSERLSWNVVRVMDDEITANENKRIIWLVNRDYASAVEADLIKGLKNG